MTCRIAIVLFAATFAIAQVRAEEPQAAWWSTAVEQSLKKAKSNRPELEKALRGVPQDQRKGMAFLIENMPSADLLTLQADFLLNNVELAYKARKEVPWGKDIPEDIFLNDVLPYANVDEKRDAWRKEFYDLCMPIVKECKTPSEAAQKLNSELFKKLKVGYSTQRKAANQSPKESIESGKASCTGLSIVLSDGCRAVSIPARLVGTPLWVDQRGNHTWVELWDRGWHFTGACEPDPKGLDRGWFVGIASQAKKDVPENAIYAASFKKQDQHFPLVWARSNKEVPGENVTDHYAKTSAKPETFQLQVKVLNAANKRVAAKVTLTAAKDDKKQYDGTSRDETADTNHFLTFELPPNTEFTLAVGTVTQSVKTGSAGEKRLIELQLVAAPAMAADTERSAAAVKELRAALDAKPAKLDDLAETEFAKIPLTNEDAKTARELIAKAYLLWLQQDRAKEVKEKVIRDGMLTMPFEYKTFGKKPAGGRSLWISLHGGGGAPKQVNDQQWENQKKLYTLEEGIYLAPRAPTNTWNLWHEAHIDRMFGRLIEDLIALEDVNPNKVYVMGYSAGGDGVYQLAPRMADYWAGAAMMAGHPNGVSLLSLRNVPFALQVGGNDSAYNRNKVAEEYGEKLDQLQKDDPKGYEHLVKIHEGKGHWMDLQDKAALPWLAKFTRNPIPDRVVWKQTGPAHDRSYWLAVPPKEAKGDSLVIASRTGQTIDIVAAEKVTKLLIHLDDRMADLNKPIAVTQNGKTLSSGLAKRCVAVMIKTLVGRGDPDLMFDAEVEVAVAAGK